MYNINTLAQTRVIFFSMTTISSKSSLVLKLLLPCFLFVFLGGVTIVTWFNPKLPDNSYLISDELLLTIRIIFTSAFISLVGIWYLLFSKLHRVDIDGDEIYASNYFKTYRYSINSIEKIETSKTGWLQMGHISFYEKTSLGKKISLILNREKFLSVTKHNNLVANKLVLEE